MMPNWDHNLIESLAVDRHMLFVFSCAAFNTKQTKLVGHPPLTVMINPRGFTDFKNPSKDAMVDPKNV